MLSSKQLSNLRYLAELGLTSMGYYGIGNIEKAGRLLHEALAILEKQRGARCLTRP